MLGWPRPKPSTSVRSRSSDGACAKVVRITWPPTKSTPKLSPLIAIRPIDSAISRVEIAMATFRQRRKAMLVSSGTSFSRRIGSDPELLGPLAQPDRDEHPGDGDGGEDRRGDADHHHDREALHRPGAEHVEREAGDDVGDVGVEDGGARFLIAVLDRQIGRASCRERG